MTKKDCITKLAKKQRVTDTLSFVNSACETHANKYTYENTIYVKTSEKLEITCKVHGAFWQLAKNHLAGKGCPKCKYVRREGKSGFIACAKNKHQGQYGYELVDYINATTEVVITCKEHGAFSIKPYIHLRGGGCKACGLLRTIASTVSNTKDFALKAMEVHSGKYTYDNVDYKNNRKKVSITCPHHGDFLQQPNYHLSKKQGCPKCRPKGWHRSGFIKACNNNKGVGYLYAIKCFNDSELFYKIGITSQDLALRFSGDSRMPYNYKVLFEIEEAPDYVYDLETKMQRALNNFKHSPELDFSGQTECFTTIKPIEQLLKKLSSTEQLQLIA